MDCGCFPGKYVQSLTVKEKVVEEATVSTPTVGASGMPHVYAIIDMDFSHRTPVHAQVKEVPIHLFEKREQKPGEKLYAPAAQIFL